MAGSRRHPDMDRPTHRPLGPHRLAADWLLACALAIAAPMPIAHAADADSIIAAIYAGPVARYGHFAPGRPHEYGRIEASTATGARLALALPETEVFEDVAPRLVQLAAGEPVQLLAVISHRDRGTCTGAAGARQGPLDGCRALSADRHADALAESGGRCRPGR